MREPYHPKTSLVHALDARVKIIFTIAFILFLSLTTMNAWPSYILFLSITLSVALISRIGIGFMLKRALLAFPFILAALPLIFSASSDRVTITISENIQFLINPSGLFQFINIAIKAWISMQAAVLFSSTTRFTDILAGLQALKVPAILVSVIGLMWRYLFLMVDEVMRMLQARASRSGYLVKTKKTGGRVLWRAKVSGGMAGSLFLRSIERSERVFAAMQSRGYDGKVPVSQERIFLTRDQVTLWIGLGLLFLVWIFGFLSGV